MYNYLSAEEQESSVSVCLSVFKTMYLLSMYLMQEEEASVSEYLSVSLMEQKEEARVSVCLCVFLFISLMEDDEKATVSVYLCICLMEEASVPVHLSKQEEEEAPVSIDLCVYLSLPLSTYVNRGGG